MNKLYIIEGVPGSGKTTTANLLEGIIRQHYPAVNKYVEGDLHPADMAWNALLTEDEFERVCKEYPSLNQAIRHSAKRWKDYWIVAYTTIDSIPDKLYQYLESKEVYDNRVDADVFCKLHEERWRDFGNTATGITIFECALLQNAVNELLLFHNKSKSEIEQYIEALLCGVSRLNPTIIYLDIDTGAAIERAASERTDEHGVRVWEERVTEYICASPYGKLHNLHGMAGMKEYFETRRKLELEILKKLPTQSYVIPVDIKTQSEDMTKALENIYMQTNEGKAEFN